MTGVIITQRWKLPSSSSPVRKVSPQSSIEASQLLFIPLKRVQLAKDSPNLNFAFAARLEDFSQLDWDGTTVGFLPFRQLMHDIVNKIPAVAMAVLREYLAHETLLCS